MPLRRSLLAGLLGAAAWFGAPEPAAAGCGSVPAPCRVSSGDYELALPAHADHSGGATALPAVVFLHGHGSAGATVMRNRSLVDGLLLRGYAVIAPTALPRWQGKRSWNFLPGREGRDEALFLREVVADAQYRAGVDPQRVLLAGFSAGAFMVNYLACSHPGDFAAYAPVAGGFWDPLPADCAGPVRLFHTHGWADTVVPLEGRFLAGGAFRQGDVFAGLALWRHVNRCPSDAPANQGARGQWSWRLWSCNSRADLVFSLVPNGHVVPGEWPHRVLDWFEARGD